MRTPVSKRVKRRKVGTSTGAVATGVDYNQTVEGYVFQEDITLIGWSAHVEALVQDAHANADGQLNVNVDLSRSGTRGDREAMIAEINMEKCWTAAVVIGNSDNREDHPATFFPEGYGIDFNEGDVINVNGLVEWIGAGGAMYFWIYFILYYVER